MQQPRPIGKYEMMALWEHRKQLEHQRRLEAIEDTVVAYSGPTALHDLLGRLEADGQEAFVHPYVFLAHLLFHVGNGYRLERYAERIQQAVMMQPDKLTPRQLAVLTIAWNKALSKQGKTLSSVYRMWKKQLLGTTGGP